MTTDGLFIEDGTDDVETGLERHIGISVVLECCTGTGMKEIPGCTLSNSRCLIFGAEIESRG